jgi:hypothetical protein
MNREPRTWLTLLALAALSSCARPSEDDAALLLRIEALEERVAALESTAPAPSARDLLAARMERDVQRLGAERVQEIERHYRAASLDLDNPESLAALAAFVDEPRYAGANRVGCALLYLGRMGPPDKAEGWLRRAIAEHGDARYGDGVQVGAYARLVLASMLRERGETAGADDLMQELRDRYPEAVDHGGMPLVR